MSQIEPRFCVHCPKCRIKTKRLFRGGICWFGRCRQCGTKLQRIVLSPAFRLHRARKAGLASARLRAQRRAA